MASDGLLKPQAIIGGLVPMGIGGRTRQTSGGCGECAQRRHLEPCLRPSFRSNDEEAMLQADAGQNRVIILGAYQVHTPKACVLAGSCLLMCPGRLLI